MNKARVALSSLAVSVSAAALLGVSGAAAADPPYCATGTTCGLGYNAHAFIVSEGQSEGVEYFEDLGSCSFDYAQSGQCGCEGGIGGGPIYTEMYGFEVLTGWVEPNYVFVPSGECSFY